MRWISLFTQRSKLLWPLLILLGIVNSMLLSLLLVFISHIINRQYIPYVNGYEWLVFFSAITVSYFLNKFFNYQLIKLSNETLFTFEVEIVNKICFSRFEAFEKIGAEKIHTAFSDARILSQLPPTFIGSLNAFVIILCGLGYLFYQSLAGGAIVVTLMAALLLWYLYRNISIERELNKLRDLQEYYYIYVLDLLNGFREIKVNTIRNENIFLKFILPNRKLSKELNSRTSQQYMDNELLGGFSWYFIIGVITFAFPYVLGFTSTQIVPYVVVILYLMGPVSVLISTLPAITNFKIALKRLNELSEIVDSSLTPAHELPRKTLSLSGFTQLVFRNVTYKYTGENRGDAFRLGPVNLTINKGELIFVTGGNGSGKTTLVMLLAGLYTPHSGEIVVSNGVKTYRAQDVSDYLSVIFSSNYLFGFNYNNFDVSQANTDFQDHLEQLKLKHIVKYDADRNIVDPKLSKGQQKRLSMAYALMEDKDLIILDEWAAEQDPTYRAFFYKNLLPGLLAKGKTIIAVTHDDKYFDLAGRILKLSNGQLITDEVLSEIPTLIKN